MKDEDVSSCLLQVLLASTTADTRYPLHITSQGGPRDDDGQAN